MTTTTVALEEELRTFRERKREFLRLHSGQYALVRGSRVIGFFDDWNTAFEESIQRFGAEPCLIKQVLEHEPVHSLPQLLPFVPDGDV